MGQGSVVGFGQGRALAGAWQGVAHDRAEVWGLVVTRAAGHQGSIQRADPYPYPYPAGRYTERPSPGSSARAAGSMRRPMVTSVSSSFQRSTDSTRWPSAS